MLIVRTPKKLDFFCQDSNKMKSKNLSIVFGPNLIRPKFGVQETFEDAKTANEIIEVIVKLAHTT